MVALAAAALVVVLAAGGSDDPERPASRPAPGPTPAPTERPASSATPQTRVREPGGELAIGITEPNPAFVRAAGVPEFDRWAAELARLRPTYYRLVVDWAGIARPDGSLDVSKPNHGCMRDLGPCAAYNGLQAQLEALAAAQRANPGRWQVMVVFTGTPEGLSVGPHGCERARTEWRSRPPAEAGLAAYAQAIRTVLDTAAAVGADLRYWSPWNEPNHPYFISPQRESCAASAPSLAPEAYAAIAETMRATLEAAPGDQRLVLGETAGLLETRSSYTDVDTFVAALPRGLVCAAGIYGQHGYVGGPDPVATVARALKRFDCPRTHEIWITEAGSSTEETPSERHSCRAMHRRLRRWYRDPRVTAAFQYTLREDDQYPTGLVTTDLGRAYPALAEWQAWGARRRPTDRPPRSRCQ